jgi:hypothetical protein
MVRGLSLLVAVLAAALCAAGAQASEVIDRNASGTKLEVNRQGQALLTYKAGGRLKRVLAWGAINASHPRKGAKQLEFKLDYSGGWGTYKRDVWKTFTNACRPYDGPELTWLVTACKAPDGSYWAIQSWQRMLPNYGLAANAKQAVWELRLSHFKGEIPKLDIFLDWSYRKYHHLYGSFTYLGKPVYGFASTSGGVPLDTWGRNLYLDTFDSGYGSGWKRENSFLTHTGTGKFCYGFYPHGNRPSGDGERYRATIIGPGVTPDVYWESDSPGEYDRESDLLDLERQRTFLAGDPTCKPL